MAQESKEGDQKTKQPSVGAAMSSVEYSCPAHGHKSRTRSALWLVRFHLLCRVTSGTSRFLRTGHNLRPFCLSSEGAARQKADIAV